ncbi:type III polyketide synthase [Phenylobacterium sp. VNQ135]|uniref:type III polyketide synthase n=1 Tax=Phenylobacterium sp. VNQ135 TaxID=3400922 RepID=UPI003C0FFB3A
MRPVSRSSVPVALLSVGTARAPYDLDQEDVAQAAQVLFEPRFPQFRRLAPVFRSAGIRTRQAVRPMEWYLEPRDWPQRMEAYAEGAVALFVAAADAALAEAGLTGPDIDIIVTVSSTGVATPSLEARAMGRMRFRPDAVRIPVFGVGCAGGAMGLALASRLAAASPEANVLLVAVEVCTTAFRTEQVDKADIVATALFGDGAAAVVLRAGEGGFAQVRSHAEHTWPDTLDIMGWRIDRDGLGVVFAQSIPPFAREHLRPAMDDMLERQDLDVGGVGRFICHPGGAKVIEALESALELGQGDLDHERAVLADHGNMSSPTVLYVLDRARRTGLPPRSVVTALGPGFTCSTVAIAA